MSSPTPSLASRIRGALFGLAVTDALGAPAEFKPRGTFATVTTMQANDNFGLGPGHFTDDTSMALCLAHSLLENNDATNPVDQARKYLAWYRRGYQSSTGHCFDIGNLTREALGVWKHAVVVDDHYGPNAAVPDVSKTREAERVALAKVDRHFNHDHYCGNGSLMRVLPVPLLLAHDLPTAVEAAAASSRVTHPHLRCVLSCALYTVLVVQCLQRANVTKATLVENLSDFVAAVEDALSRSSTKSASESASRAFLERFESYLNLDRFNAKHIDEIRSSGYVLDSLEAALWTLFTTPTFRDGAIKVVNLGDDADTVGAIYGGLAGAFYGHDQIPEEWLRDLQSPGMVEDVADKIVASSARSEGQQRDLRRSQICEEIQASVNRLGL